MAKRIIKILYAAYLSGALGMFTNVTYRDWQFYAVLIPVVILVEIGQEGD